jgi:hypothetical protein
MKLRPELSPRLAGQRLMIVTFVILWTCRRRVEDGTRGVGEAELQGGSGSPGAKLPQTELVDTGRAGPVVGYRACARARYPPDHSRDWGRGGRVLRRWVPRVSLALSRLSGFRGRNRMSRGRRGSGWESGVLGQSCSVASSERPRRCRQRGRGERRLRWPVGGDATLAGCLRLERVSASWCTGAVAAESGSAGRSGRALRVVTVAS